MKLISLRVKNFRSVEDSGEFSVEHSTCLVGKNESGKTAILQALAGLNPHPATPFEYKLERDYPKRYLAKYKEKHSIIDALVVSSKWKLSEKTIDALKSEFGEDSLTGETVRIIRRYNSSGPAWTVPLDETAAINHLISNSNFSAVEKSQVGGHDEAKTLVQKLTELAPSNSKFQSLLDRVKSYRNSSLVSKFIDICKPAFPQFMYFSNYDRMSAEVHLPSLKAAADNKTLFAEDRLRGDRLFWEFLEFSGVTLDEILNAPTFEDFNAKLLSASNSLTDDILEYWTQNPDLEIRVNVATGLPNDPAPFNNGLVGRARIYNQLHRSDTLFSERSAGFTWFFSFLVKFDRVKKESSNPIFLLLDEPGLTLHGKAQADLLRYFKEKLEPHHQILYSTHSPFMVPHDDLLSSRIVEDLVEVDDRGRRKPTGTKVREDVLGRDQDSIFPLQGALGYSITQSLFVGKHVLLVEGPSDILYLKALSSELVRRGKVGLHPEWTICPSGGLDNIKPFISLFAGNDLDVIAITDFAKRDSRKLEKIRESEVLKAGGLLSYADFVDGDEADVEDLLSPELFCALINAAYQLKAAHKITPKKLQEADETTVRQVKKAEAYFRLLPDTIPMLDHFQPASFLLQNPNFLQEEEEHLSKVLDRTETMFQAINKLKKN